MSPRASTPQAELPVSVTAAAETLDRLLADRAGWVSTDRGWSHKKSGLSIEARQGVTPFRIVKAAGGEVALRTRTALELYLGQAGA